ncbi:hypothetical protein ACSIGC_16545 [Tenacibaculum sp. ZS6-P6]|uniref:hypothetical protein n=1 Tax=Tenacibaculum sp. ZS6-P6 TaxID=3447503 RepID=UPI003F943871
MSVRVEIFNELSSRLENMNFFQIIDIYKGQFSDEEANGITNFPAVYISISKIDYEEMTVDFIEGRAVVDVYVFFKQFNNTDILDKNKPSSLEILTIMDETVDKLHGATGSFFSELSQTGEEDLSFIYEKPAFKISFSTEIRKRVELGNYILN